MSSEQRTPVSRRAFLAQLATGSAALAAIDSIGAPSLYAADDGPKELHAHYANGILVEATQGHIGVVVPGYGPPITVILTDQTQICKGDCNSTWEVLRIHDRIECGTFIDSNGARVAKWCNANPVYSWATVDTLEGNLLHVKHIPEMPFMSGPDRALQINAYTHVTVQDQEAYGRADLLQAGDMIYYTGCANDPDLNTSVIMAIVVAKTGSMSGYGHG